jgi:hypothetical protein
MKKLILLGFIAILTITVANAQTKVKGTLYKSDHWADIKGKGDWATAMDNPTKEKVEILVTEKYIKVTFGSKVSNYKVVSKNRFSSVKMDYNVSLNGKSYLISIADMPDGTKAIGIEKTWMVADISDISEIEVSE